MANSVVESILEYLATRLSAVSGASFYRSREEAIAKAEGVAGLLFPGDETSDYLGSFAKRTVKINVSVIARGQIPDQVADPVRVAAFAAIMADRTLGGLCANIFDEETRWELAEADQNAVEVTTMFRVIYMTPIATIAQTA
jgi:hypothetical protein